MRLISVCFAFFIGCIAPISYAQYLPEPKEPKFVEARNVVNTIAIDGQLNEADWQNVMPAGDFTQYEPNENTAPSFRSEVRVLYGSNALYIGAKLYDDKPNEIFRPLGRRDEFLNDDRFSVSIDSYFDKKSAYIFGVNAANVQTDGLLTESNGGGGGGNNNRGEGFDRSWDAVWDSAVRVTSEGWTIEMRIPYSMLRFNDHAEQTWGVNFRRTIGRLGEVDTWVYIPRSERFPITQYGQIKGLNNLKPRRNVQVLPYTLAQVNSYKEEGEVIKSKSLNAGADVKYGLTSHSILDLSINPDFGQVESDPAELNLTSFETVLQERRPFFLEGSQIFDYIFGGMEGGMLYTRRIGAADPDTGEEVPIIGSAKLTGQTDKGLSYGVLGSVTGADFNPDLLFTAARVKKNIGQYSKIGSGLTYYNRQSDPKSSVVGGVDWDLRLKNNVYQVNGHFTLTHVGFPQTATTTPDDNEDGFISAMRLFKLQGNTTWGGGIEFYSPEANPNAVGRLRDYDYIEAFGNFRRLINNNKPFGIFRRAQFNTFFWNRWTYSQNIGQGVGVFLFGNGQLTGFQNVNFGFNTDGLGGLDMRETRDLRVPYKAPYELNFNGGIQSDSRRQYRLQPRFNLSFQEGGGTATSFGIEGNWNIGTRLGLVGSVSYQTNHKYQAWMSNEVFTPIVNGWGINTNTDGLEIADLKKSDFQAFNDGNVLTSALAKVQPYEGTTNRYYMPIFGIRERESLEMVLRTNVTFTPKISFQLFSQLFVARGQYSDTKILTGPESLISLPNYPKRHDFRFNNFQSNAVFRWEYRPGSVFYLVWSQSRGDEIFEADFHPQTPSPYLDDTASLIQNTFGIFPNNAILMKFNYLLMR